MIIKCKGFYSPILRKIVKNCYIKWNKREKSINLLKNHNYKPDVEMKYILPPFADTHVHLFLSGTKNLKKREEELNCTLEHSLEIAQKNIKKLLENGIYSVRDAGDSKLCAIQLRDKMKNFKILASGKALYKKGRYGSFIGYEISDKKSLKNALENLLILKIDFIKVLNSGINSIKTFAKDTGPQFSYNEFRYITDFAKDNNLKVIVHANGEKAIRETIKHNIYSIEHGFFIGKENIKKIIDNKIKIVPTFSAMYNLIEYPCLTEKEKNIIKLTVEHHINEIREFVCLGGDIGLGTDSGSFNVIHGKSFFQEITFFLKKLNLTFEQVISIICPINEYPFLIEMEKKSCNALINGYLKIFA